MSNGIPGLQRAYPRNGDEDDLDIPWTTPDRLTLNEMRALLRIMEAKPAEHEHAARFRAYGRERFGAEAL